MTKELLTRDAILGLVDIKTEDVFVPEWDATVRIKGMTAAERDDFEASRLTGRGKSRDVNMQNYRAALLVRVIVNAKGERIFSNSDAHVLGQKSAGAIDLLVDRAQKLSGIRDEDVEELVGNSDGDQSDDSPSALRVTSA